MNMFPLKLVTLCRVVVPVPGWNFGTGLRGSFEKIHIYMYNMMDNCLESV